MGRRLLQYGRKGAPGRCQHPGLGAWIASGPALHLLSGGAGNECLLCSVSFPGSSAGKESACNAGDPGSIPGSGRSFGEGIGYQLQYFWTSLVAQMVKNLPAMWETWVQSLGHEDPLEKEMATHSSTLAWKIPWTEECGRLQSMGSQRVRHD